MGRRLFLGDPLAVIGKFDRVVEAYELEGLVQRIVNVLEVHGVLTVADYQEALLAARNDAQNHSLNREA